jgi:hypothetical protein
VPRHPPCALTNLTIKMLASTVQFSNYGRSHVHIAAYTKPTPPKEKQADAVRRDRSPLAAKPPTPNPKARTGGSRRRSSKHPPKEARLILQDPTARLGHSPTTTSVPAVTPTPHRSAKQAAVLDPYMMSSRPTSQCSTLEPHPRSERPRREY